LTGPRGMDQDRRPAIVTAETFERAARRLPTTSGSLPATARSPPAAGLAACSACGYGYYRTSTRTTNKRSTTTVASLRRLPHQGGRVCGNKPVRAGYLDTVVWTTSRTARQPCADPRRDQQTPAAGPHRRSGHQAAQTAGTRPGQSHDRDHPHDRAFQEQLITIDELRPGCRTCGPARLTCVASSVPWTPSSPTRRLPQTRRRPGRIPHPAASQHQRRRCPRTPARPAAPRQRRPHRPGEDHHPAPHPIRERTSHSNQETNT